MRNDKLNMEVCDVISDKNIPFNAIANSSVLVTGAGGLIGSCLIRELVNLNKNGSNINIIAHTRKTHGDVQDSASFQNIDTADYIFHCASVTKSEDMFCKPVDVMSIALCGTKNVLELAKRVKAKSLVYLSSMEVYGQCNGETSEKNLGYLDLSNPRSSYPESKRACEMLCKAYQTQYGVPIKIARLAQTFGEGVPKTDMRVFAQFARSAINVTDIILHTEGRSIGNYCYITDSVRALFTLLLKGIDGEAYNISNPNNTMTIREMAELVAKIYGIKVKIEVPKDSERLGYAAQTGYRLNIDKIKSLGWQPKYGLDEMYKRMIDNWQLSANQEEVNN